MRIRQTLQLSGMVCIVSVVLLATTLTLLQRMNADHAQATVNLNAAVRKISLLRGLLPDLSRASLERASQLRATRQWHAQYAELTPLLSVISALNAQTAALKARIVEDNSAIGPLFEKLTSTDQGSLANLDLIGEQLEVRTASMVSDVLAINDNTMAYINYQTQWMHGLMALSGLLLAGVIVGLQLVFHRRIVRPIILLEAATTNFSAGILDQAIVIEGSDEITKLASSFDYMRRALRERLIELDAARTLIKQENALLAQRVDERTHELKAANFELDSFAYAVSHDLRAPLRALIGFSKALSEDFGVQLTGEARIDLDQIHLASTRMGELIDGLLVLSRSTRVPLQHDEIDLTALAQRIVAELVQAQPQRTIMCSIEAGMSVRGDPRMLAAAMANLLGNAWKYTERTLEANIKVYKEAEDESGKGFICISDNGAGFNMAHAEKLFQPFQRLHRQEEFPGNGIGLATVSRIVQRHGGTIKAEGAPGKGATFCFSLPSAEGVGHSRETG